MRSGKLYYRVFLAREEKEAIDGVIELREEVFKDRNATTRVNDELSISMFDDIDNWAIANSYRAASLRLNEIKTLEVRRH